MISFLHILVTSHVQSLTFWVLCMDNSKKVFWMSNSVVVSTNVLVNNMVGSAITDTFERKRALEDSEAVSGQ